MTGSHEEAWYLTKHYSWCFYHSIFRLTFKLIDWVKQIAFPSVDKPYLISWRPHLHMSKRGFLLPDCLWTRTLAFTCLQIWAEILSLPVSWAWQSLNWTTPVAVLGLQLADLGLVDLHNCWLIIAWANSIPYKSLLIYYILKYMYIEIYKLKYIYWNIYVCVWNIYVFYFHPPPWWCWWSNVHMGWASLHTNKEFGIVRNIISRYTVNVFIKSKLASLGNY